MRVKCWLAVLLIGAVIQYSAKGEPDTFPRMWEAVCKGIETGRLEMSLERLQEFENWYGEENEFLRQEFQIHYLPLSSLIHLLNGKLKTGEALAQRYFQTFPKEKKHHALLLYFLGVGFHQQGNLDEAAVHYRRFISELPERKETALIEWKLIEIEIQKKEFSKALEKIETLINDQSTPNFLAISAKLVKEQLNLNNNDSEYKSNFRELIKEIPESHFFHYWLRGISPYVAKKLAYQKSFKEADKTLWYYTPKETLVSKIEGFSKESQKKRSNNTKGLRNRIWSLQFNEITKKLKASLDLLLKTYPDRESINLDRLYQLQEAQRYQTLLGLSTALNQYLPQLKQKTEALRIAIETATKLKKWELAESLAKIYLEEFPKSDSIHPILFSLYKSRWEKGEKSRAINGLHELVNTQAPSYRDKGTWLFTLGKWQSEFGKFEQAFRSYNQAEEILPKPWKSYIDFERAKTKLTQGNIHLADKTLNDIRKSPELPHSLLPEILIESAKIKLSSGDFENLSEIARELKRNVFDPEYNSIGNYFDAKASSHNKNLQQAHEHLEAGMKNLKTPLFGLLYLEKIKLYLAEGRHKASAKLIIDALNPEIFAQIKDHLPDIISTGRNEEKTLTEIESKSGTLYSIVSQLAKNPNYEFSYEILHLVNQLSENKADYLSIYDNLVPHHKACSWDWNHAAILINYETQVDLIDSHWIALSEKNFPKFPSPSALSKIARTLKKYDLPNEYFFWNKVLSITSEDSLRSEALYELASQTEVPENYLDYLFLVENSTDSYWINKSQLKLAEYYLKTTQLDKAQKLINDLLNEESLAASSRGEAIQLLANYHLAKGEPKESLVLIKQIHSLYKGFPKLIEEASRIELASRKLLENEEI